MNQIDLTDNIRKACVNICQMFHISVEEASKKFFEEQKRKTYVTPTSYLELLGTFQSLHSKRVDQLTTQRMRYVVGLEKLDFAASQISIMSKELTDLQPKLIAASETTEKLMVKIEKDTAVVEKQKEVYKYNISLYL